MSDDAVRVGLTISGDARDPTAFSGQPASLLGGLSDAGVEVSPLSTELPDAMQRALVNFLVLGFLEPRRLSTSIRAGTGVRLAVREHKPKLLPSREMMAIRSAVVAGRLRRHGPFERIIQFGSAYRLPHGSDYVTLDDATIAGLRRSYPYSWMNAVSQPELMKMIARQGAIFRRARACCVLDGWAARSAHEDYGVPNDRIHVVGAGPNRALVPTRRSWDVPRFLFVGKDFERKNGARVIEAFGRVRAAHPRATLDLVGGHPRLDIEGVRCHGLLRLDRQDESAKLDVLFADATCFVMPSLLEPAGSVYAEALASGIGSIGTTSGGAETIIGDGGLCVDPLDDQAIFDAMLEFCSPERMQEYGHRAELRAPLFTWRVVAERVIRALDLPGFENADLADFL